MIDNDLRKEEEKEEKENLPGMMVHGCYFPIFGR